MVVVVVVLVVAGVVDEVALVEAVVVLRGVKGELIGNPDLTG